jgi:hypothetical protein
MADKGWGQLLQYIVYGKEHKENFASICPQKDWSQDILFERVNLTLLN